VEIDQEQGQGGDALLAIDQIVFAVAFADDDGAEEVVFVGTDFRGGIALLVAIEKLVAEVSQEFVNIFFLYSR
jgi:hypothetical protein